jgi:hypothetical protein
VTVSMVKSPSKVNLLPAELGSLSRELPPTEPGTLFVLGSMGGMSVAPDAGFQLMFGRNEPDVHVCVGGRDPHVSRRHGIIRRTDSRWVLDNVGKLPIRLPGSLVIGGAQAELPTGYTPLFIVAPQQEHLLQVRITAPTPPHAWMGECEAETSRQVWRLSDVERLVLVCLSRRYLRHEPQDPLPQPLAWGQVADELSELRPDENWNWRRAARIVSEVRARLSGDRRRPVRGLREDEVRQPVGNALNHNLIMELLISTTITRADLSLLDGDATGRECGGSGPLGPRPRKPLRAG